MKTKKRTYILSIEKHLDGYLAYFPALPGCHTWGRTYEGAVKYAEEALVGHLDALIAYGDNIPEEVHTAAPVSLGIMVKIPVVD